jgi:hypothetical protein
MDSGAGSSYASAKLIHELHIKPLDVQTKKIDMLMCSKQARLETYEVKIESTENNFAMTTNLINVQNALQSLPEPTIYGWLDSTVALHWIRGEGQYRQFVANRVPKINQHPEIRWRHVPTKDNPADIASRGGHLSKKSLWWNGPEWLDDPEKWSDNLETQPSTAIEVEAKVVREVLCTCNTSPASS